MALLSLNNMPTSSTRPLSSYELSVATLAREVPALARTARRLLDAGLREAGETYVLNATELQRYGLTIRDVIDAAIRQVPSLAEEGWLEGFIDYPTTYREETVAFQLICRLAP